MWRPTGQERCVVPCRCRQVTRQCKSDAMCTAAGLGPTLSLAQAALEDEPLLGPKTYEMRTSGGTAWKSACKTKQGIQKQALFRWP